MRFLVPAKNEPCLYSMTRIAAPAPPGHQRDARSRVAGNVRARARFAGARLVSKPKRRPPRPGASTQDPGSDTTCSDAEGCQRSRTPTDFEQNSDGEYEVFVAEGAPMPSIAQRDKYVSCRPVPGGMRLTLRRAEEQSRFLDVKGTLEELEEAVPEVDEDCLDDEGPWNSTKPSAKPVWRWRGGTGPNRRHSVPQGGPRGEFSQAAWPNGPRRVSLERPHSAQYAKDVHRKSPYTHARPASAKAALVTPPRPPSAKNTRPSSAVSRPSSAVSRPPGRPGSGRPKPSRPLRPASAPSARPPSRPSSGSAVRPSSARPASGSRPDSARPASARPASATGSAQPDLEDNWTRPTSGISGISERPQEIPSQLRPESAPVFKRHSKDVSHFEVDSVCSQPAGRSILFQQQDFLEKQLAENHGKLNQCFTTLMQNWVSSYQKSRLRARMACRPLFGEGSDATFTFPKTFAPVPPPLTKPKKRDLEEEMRQLEIALEGSASGEAEDDDVRPLESVKTIAAGRRGALQTPLDPGQLDLTGTIGKKISTHSQAESKVQAVRTLPYETSRGAMTPCASTVFNNLSMREPSVGGGTEGTSVSGLELSEGSDLLSPVFGMMPKRDALEKVFHRVADDGEVHKDVLCQSLELLGIRHIKQEWVVKILSTVTRFTTLSFEEYSVFVHAYIDLQSREYENAFFELDKDGSGTIEAEEIGNLLRSINVTPMEQVVAELTQEFDADNSGDIGLEEFCKLLAVINEREGFSKSEYDREHELASQPDLDKEIVDKRWNQLHRKNAKLVHQHILKYRGFLTKFGQAASTKAGSLPAPWVEELRDLQDELPISNYQDTEFPPDSKTCCQKIRNMRMLSTSFNINKEQGFDCGCGMPLVCVKVQHHGVGSLMKTDLVTIEFIAAKMMKLHKGAPDFTDLIREWRRAAVEEVDFQLEAKNAMQASNALRRHSVDVTCPEPLLNLCSRRVLTMVFIEGWKITDLDRMPYGADREGLARNLVHAFALLVFQEGLIHGDPHPGVALALSI
eukprot:s1269_g5.t1